MTSFSIVTVVYNDISHIRQTMDFVIKQNYKNIEYILIDGNSNDGTKEVIFEHISSCADIILETIESEKYYLEAIHKEYPTLSFKFLSEKDSGIYDAMNKGIALATKEWINFINCGDRFYDLKVLQKVANKNLNNCDVVYGDLNIVYLDQKLSIIKKTSHDLKKLYALFYYFGHPNCFVKTKIHKNNIFNLSYKLSADYDLIYRLYKMNLNFCFLDIVIASFYSGGASDKMAFRSIKEALQIALSYNSKNPITMVKIYFFYYFAILKKIAKLYLPLNFSKIILKVLKKK